MDMLRQIPGIHARLMVLLERLIVDPLQRVDLLAEDSQIHPQLLILANDLAVILVPLGEVAAIALASLAEGDRPAKPVGLLWLSLESFLIAPLQRVE